MCITLHNHLGFKAFIEMICLQMISGQRTVKSHENSWKSHNILPRFAVYGPGIDGNN